MEQQLLFLAGLVGSDSPIEPSFPPLKTIVAAYQLRTWGQGQRKLS